MLKLFWGDAFDPADQRTGCFLEFAQEIRKHLLAFGEIFAQFVGLDALQVQARHIKLSVYRVGVLEHSHHKVVVHHLKSCGLTDPAFYGKFQVFKFGGSDSGKVAGAVRIAGVAVYSSLNCGLCHGKIWVNVC
ncbi:MAG: hypothetical protein AAF998_10505 [Bacteroidota bacterium]